LIFNSYVALHKQAKIIQNNVMSSHMLLRKTPNGQMVRIISFKSLVTDHQCEWSAELIPGARRPKEGVSCGELFFLETDLQIWHNRMYFPLAVLLQQSTDTQLAYINYRGDKIYEDHDHMSLEQQKKRIDDRLGWK
jgi:hypothetical protein